MSARLQILWLKSGPLHPLDTGGKIRTYHTLRELAKRHHVRYLALWPEGTDESVRQSASEYSQEQTWIPWREARKGSLAAYGELAANLFSPLPYVLSKYCSPQAVAVIQDLQQRQRSDLIVCDFLTPSVNLFGHGVPQTHTLLFQHNVESLIWKRLFENARGLKRAYFGLQWRRLERFERNTCRRFDGVVGVSDADCRIMREEFGLGNVLGAVPTGVDLTYFQPPVAPRKPNALVFLGSMDWRPNVDSIDFFVAEIFPEIKRIMPDVSFTIVGRKPPESVVALARRDARIKVTGTVPDVRPYLAEATALVVPLRVGGGTRIKIFEGMAAGVPVVSTRIGAEGLPVTDGEHILLADEPARFAQRTCDLLKDAEMQTRLSRNGRQFVADNFSWEKVAEVFEKYCQQTARSKERV